MKHRLSVLILFLIFLPSLYLVGQSNNTFDSLVIVAKKIESDTARVEYLLDRIWEFRLNNPDISFALLEEVQVFQTGMEPKYKLDVPEYYYGIMYRTAMEYEKAEKHYLNYYEMNKEENKPRKMAAVKLALTNLYADQDFYAKGMETAKEALELYSKTDDTLNMVRTYRKVASFMASMNQLDDALQYNRTAFRIATEFKDSLEISDAINDIGIAYEKMGIVDSMFYYYNQYYELGQKLKNKQVQIYANFNLSTAYDKVGKTDRAYTYAERCLELCKETQNRYMGLHAQAMLSSLCISSGRVNEGIERAKEALRSDNLTQGLKRTVFSSLYEGYKLLGDSKQALNYHEQFKTVSDSILNSDISRQVTSLEGTVEAERKENEIALLNSENQLIELELSKAGRERWLFIIGLVALLSIIGLLYRVIKSGKENRRLLENKNKQIQEALSDKETLLREIHHRVKNNLQVISSLLSLQSRQIDDPTAQLAIKEGRNRVKSMALIHQNLYQDEDLVGVDISEYITKLTRSLVSSYQLEENVNVVTDIESIKMDVDQIIPLGLILNELISNSLKYAFNSKEIGEISIHLKSGPENIEIEVADNGKGLPEGFSVDKLDSLGYKLVKSFTQKLKAKFEISDQKKGTKINIQIPHKHAA